MTMGGYSVHTEAVDDLVASATVTSAGELRATLYRPGFGDPLAESTFAGEWFAARGPFPAATSRVGVDVARTALRVLAMLLELAEAEASLDRIDTLLDVAGYNVKLALEALK